MLTSPAAGPGFNPQHVEKGEELPQGLVASLLEPLAAEPLEVLRPSMAAV